MCKQYSKKLKAIKLFKTQKTCKKKNLLLLESLTDDSHDIYQKNYLESYKFLRFNVYFIAFCFLLICFKNRSICELS